MDDYLAKPVDPHAFVEVLERWLSKGNGNGEGTRNEQEAGPTYGGAKGAAKAAIPVFDQAGMLERVLNDEDLVGLILEAFLSEFPHQIEKLKNALDADDVPASRRHAHSIKGAAANVGGETMREVAGMMEEAGSVGDLDSIRASLIDLDAQFEKFKEAVGERL